MAIDAINQPEEEKKMKRPISRSLICLFLLLLLNLSSQPCASSDLPPCEKQGTNVCVPVTQPCPEGSENANDLFTCAQPLDKCCTYWE
jgi:hypothetical protein